LVSGIWTNSPGGSNNPAVLPADQSAEFFRLEMREVDSAVILCQLNAHHQIHLRRADRGGLDAAIPLDCAGDAGGQLQYFALIVDQAIAGD
jgi:hypothetical protein